MAAGVCSDTKSLFTAVYRHSWVLFLHVEAEALSHIPEHSLNDRVELLHLRENVLQPRLGCVRVTDI